MYKIVIEYAEFIKAKSEMIKYVATYLQKSETLECAKKSITDFDPSEFLGHVITVTYRKLCERANHTKNGLLYMLSTLIRRELKESEENKYSEKDVIIVAAICNKIDKLLQNDNEYDATVMLTDIMACMCDDERIAKLIDVETEDPWI